MQTTKSVEYMKLLLIQPMLGMLDSHNELISIVFNQLNHETLRSLRVYTHLYRISQFH